MKITVDGFRGCKQAILEGGPLVIVGGTARSGKSSLCQAVGAVLSGKWAIEDAVAGGMATASMGAGAATISWPDAIFTANEDWKPCSEIAVGRWSTSQVPDISTPLDCLPDEAMVITQFTKSGLSDPVAAQLWSSIQAKGWEAVAESMRVHGTTLTEPKAIETNTKLHRLLGPQGLRMMSAESAMEKLNARMKEIASPWPAVSLDNHMRLWVGGRSMKDASDSERIMARAVFQIAIAQIDESPMIVLDLGGWFDVHLRNNLAEILAREKMAAMIAYTCNRARQVPDVSATTGTAYWMEDGLVRPRSECAT